MGQEPMLEPLPGSHNAAKKPAPFHAEAERATCLAARSHSINFENEVGHSTFAAEQDDNPSAAIDSAISAVAAVLTSDRTAFLQFLGYAVDTDNSPATRAGLYREVCLGSDETSAFELVAVVVHELKAATAATICAALAARTAAQSLLDAKGVFGMEDCEALLAAWLDVARAVAAARGSRGLLRLMPTARLAERGELAAEIATAMHRVATRIAAGPPFWSSGNWLNRETRRSSNAERDIGFFSPYPDPSQVEFSFNTH
jgi:hypothetical protein